MVYLKGHFLCRASLFNSHRRRVPTLSSSRLRLYLSNRSHLPTMMTAETTTASPDITTCTTSTSLSSTTSTSLQRDGDTANCTSLASQSTGATTNASFSTTNMAKNIVAIPPALILHHHDAANSTVETPTCALIPSSERCTPNTDIQPIHGFENLDDVQRYAIGALAVVLLNRHSNDLNGVAFARTQCLALFDALKIHSGQQEALLALNPSTATREDVVTQCVKLVGEPPHRFLAVQAMLALAIAPGTYDARSRAFLMTVTHRFGIAWPAVAAVELALAVHLFNHKSDCTTDNSDTEVDLASDTIDPGSPDCSETLRIDFDDLPDTRTNTLSTTSHANTTNPFSTRYFDTVENTTNIGCSTEKPFAQPEEPARAASQCYTSLSHQLSKPPANLSTCSERTDIPTLGQVLIQRRKKKHRVRKAMKIGGITLVGGVLFGLTGGLIAPALLTALANVGVASAAGLAASGTIASGTVVGGLFGVAGGGMTLRKARNRVSTNLDEFDFERSDDPRVITERKRKEEREQRRRAKTAAKLLAEEAARNQTLAIEGAESQERFMNSNAIDTEKELPRPPNSLSDDELDIEVDDAVNDITSTSNRKGKKESSIPFGKRRLKREKLKVGARALESTASIPSLHVCICVPAWLTDRAFGSSLEQFESALQKELPYSQHIALRWESSRLYEMGLAFAKFWASKATVTTVQQAYPHAVAAASTVAGAVAFAFAIPLTVMSCLDYIDNPWSILVSRSNGAGEELADVLVERSYGHRPVTLFGYSIGARVIFKCLESLASRGALGIVDNVFLLGAAVTADPERWRRIRRVVAGRIVNAYGSYDWALAFFHRGCGHGVYVSGLRRVELEGVENLNVAYLGIEGHKELKDSVPRVMRAMGVGLGYISMPPAKLVINGKAVGVGWERQGNAIAKCEEPAGVGWVTEDMGSGGAGIEVGERGRGEIGGWIGGDGDGDGDDRGGGGERGGGKVVREVDEVVAEVKKQKSKSWFPWSGWDGGWPGIGGKRGKKERRGDLSDGNELSVGGEALGVEGVGAAGDVKEKVVSGGLDGEEQRVAGKDEREGVVVMGGNGEIGKVGGDKGDGDESFDWEKQQGIWAEQERQLKERGYADGAAQIEMGKRMMFAISVEVAGRRLETFLEQDLEFPSRKVEKVFTNCVEDQRGMHVRVYEHGRKMKSVACNVEKTGKKYPKLLMELEVRLRRMRVKGGVRVAVTVWADGGGNVHCVAEERIEEGEGAEGGEEEGEGKGDKVEGCVEREVLCSVEERRVMEEEEKLEEARLQRELLQRAEKKTPALLMAGPMQDGMRVGGKMEMVATRDDVDDAEEEGKRRSVDGNGNRRNLV